MKSPCWIALALALAAGTATAQLYKWVDKDGKVRYGDTPPAGAKTSSVKAPAAPPAAAPDAKAGAKDAAKPMTPAEREQDYRRRQAEARKSAEKQDAESRAKSQREENCARAKEYLGTLQSGQRIARTDAKGERYYMDDAQIASETAKAEQGVRESCK